MKMQAHCDFHIDADSKDGSRVHSVTACCDHPRRSSNWMLLSTTSICAARSAPLIVGLRLGAQSPRDVVKVKALCSEASWRQTLIGTASIRAPAQDEEIEA